jgi:hypothetical protein
MTAKFDEKLFKSLYTGPHTKTDAKDGTAIEYVGEDSEYRVYIPGKKKDKSTLEAQPGGGLKLVLVQDHIIHVTSKDDHANVYLTFDAHGKITDYSHEISIEDGKVNTIPDWVPKVIDLGVEALGALGALETAGISEVAAQEVVADIKKFCDTFNKIITKWAHLADDGGRLNFPAEVCHNMNKAAVSVPLV